MGISAPVRTSTLRKKLLMDSSNRSDCALCVGRTRQCKSRCPTCAQVRHVYLGVLAQGEIPKAPSYLIPALPYLQRDQLSRHPVLWTCPRNAQPAPRTGMKCLIVVNQNVCNLAATSTSGSIDDACPSHEAAASAFGIGIASSGMWVARSVFELHRRLPRVRCWWCTAALLLCKLVLHLHMGAWL